MKMRPIPLGKPRSLVHRNGGRLILRMTSPTGEQIATTLRAMTPRDAFAPPRFRRPPK